MIRGHWKLVLDRESGARELYDLAADPGEQVNLAQKEPARAAQLADELNAALAQPRKAPELPQVDPEERRQLQALGYLGD